MYTDLPEPEIMNEMNACTNCILAVVYNKVNISKDLKQYLKLRPKEQEGLWNLFEKHDNMFDGTLEK